LLVGIAKVRGSFIRVGRRRDICKKGSEGRITRRGFKRKRGFGDYAAKSQLMGGGTFIKNKINVDVLRTEGKEDSPSYGGNH